MFEEDSREYNREAKNLHKTSTIMQASQVLQGYDVLDKSV